MEDMRYYKTEKGTPQGGLISPILANVYLHYVLDLYFEKRIKPICKGNVYLVRYADDFMILCQYENEAKEIYKVLVKRFKIFGLEMEESKTRILPFGRFKGTDETFDFLGFTHYNGVTRTGKYTVGHKISKKKKKQKRENIKKWIKEHRHIDIFKIIKHINRVLTGLYAYYGINGTYRELKSIQGYAFRTIYNICRKRSQRNKITMDDYLMIIKIQPLSRPKIYKNIWI